MSQLTNINAVTRAQMFSRLGSFWTSVFADQPHAKILLALAQETGAMTAWKSTLDNLAGKDDLARQVKDVVVKFKSADVMKTGMLLYDDPDREIDYTSLPEVDASYNLFRIRYSVLTVQNVLPLSIQAKTKKLLIGVDFFVLQEQFIFFRQDPKELFPNNTYVISLGLRTDYLSLTSYLVRTPLTENGSYVVDYYRKFQTPKQFKLALAAAGGLAILNGEQPLVGLNQVLGAVVYTFSNQVLRVAYPHTLLTVGTVYPDDFVVGDGVNVYQAGEGNSSWWRQVDWRGGLSLDPIMTDFKGLFLVDRDTVAYSSGSDSDSIDGSRLHARIKLSDSFFTEKPYWDYVGARETSFGNYLNSFLDLSEETGVANPSVLDTFAKMLTAYTEANAVNALIGLPNEDPDLEALAGVKIVNALDVYFQALLDRASYAVILDINQIPDPGTLFSFLIRELPIGGVPIIFAYGPDLPIESLTINDNLTVVESMVRTSTIPLAASESLDLTTVWLDRVYLTGQRPSDQ